MPSKLGITLAGTFNSQFDPDALAFISAATITDPQERYAINDLVTGLKLNSLWSKFNAIYPFAGSTATTHKWNLKDPRDLDAAFRLSFNGGWTHASTGALPNGTNAYADTFLVPSTSISQNDVHISYYSRTNSSQAASLEIGSQRTASIQLGMQIRSGSNNINAVINSLDGTTSSNLNSLGFYIGNRKTSAEVRAYKNGTLSVTTARTSASPPTFSIYLGARNNQAVADLFSNREAAFASIGTGFSDADALTFTSLVQRYQTALSRAIVAVPTVQDLDAQNFLVAAAITDSTQAQAVQNLTAGLKFNSLWTKMQAAYPFVGGTSTTHKFNLKSPLDADASFRLTFTGGFTQNSNGITPNGTNAFANTFYNMNTSGSLNDSHISVYSRTNVQKTGGKDIAALSAGTGTQTYLELRDTANQSEVAINDGGSLATSGFTDSSGLFVGSRPDASNTFLYRNTTQKTFTKASGSKTNVNLFLSALNNNGTAQQFSPRNLAWASIGSGLSSTDVTNLYTVVQAYQTELSRNV